MDKLVLKPIILIEDKHIFIKEIQQSFQYAYEKEFGKFEEEILPKSDVEEAFNEKNTEAYFAEIDGKRVGGVIISINDKTGYNSLQFLYVKLEFQNKGNGLKIWKAIENLYPKTKVWETHTPYFDKRNIHFYVNRCGFKIVEFFNHKHKDLHKIGKDICDIPEENNYLFRFEKEIK